MMTQTEFYKRLRASGDRVSQILDRFSQARVLVVGDLTLDEFVTGQVERVSREAPVLILRHRDTQRIPGAGANAAYNLAKLGAQVKVVGLVGQDEQGQALRAIFEAVGIDTAGMLIDPDRPTVTKTRISGHARQSVTQQIVRIDRKADELPRDAVRSRLSDYIHQHLTSVDVVVCSDYGDGVLTESVIAAALRHPYSMVDAQQDLARFAGATLFTPNLPEAEQAVGFAVRDAASLQQAAQSLLTLTRAHHLLITRGEEGMSLFGQDACQENIPAFNRTDVFDVTGAGDTVVAALALGWVAGATPWEAAVLGNLAASLVIRQFGTATTTVSEMQTALQDLLAGDGASTTGNHRQDG